MWTDDPVKDAERYYSDEEEGEPKSIRELYPKCFFNEEMTKYHKLLDDTRKVEVSRKKYLELLTKSDHYDMLVDSLLKALDFKFIQDIAIPIIKEERFVDVYLTLRFAERDKVINLLKSKEDNK